MPGPHAGGIARPVPDGDKMSRDEALEGLKLQVSVCRSCAGVVFYARTNALKQRQADVLASASSVAAAYNR